MGSRAIVTVLFELLGSKRNIDRDKQRETGKNKTYHTAAALSTPSLPTSQPANTMPIVSLYSVTKEQKYARSKFRQ